MQLRKDLASIRFGASQILRAALARGAASVPGRYPGSIVALQRKDKYRHSMIRESAIDVMRREMQVVRRETAPDRQDCAVEKGSYSIDRENFFLHADCGLKISYRKGSGVSIQYGENTTALDERLFIDGTTYAAVASINGFFPVHASAVAVEDRVFAFTAESGAGKSTLVAELARQGLPMFCDDSLVLDLRDEDCILALPGNKQLKLWPDALALTGAAPQGLVWEGEDKRYAEPSGEMDRRTLPLAELCFLEEGEPAAIEPVIGANRLRLFQDMDYVTDIYMGASELDGHEQFRLMARLARDLKITRFIRPRDASRFRADAEIMVRHIFSYGKTGS